MNLATVGAIVLASISTLLLGMAGLIRTMLFGRLDKLDAKLDGQDGRLNQHDGRLIRLEEWRENERGALGRRKQDHCPVDDCPIEATRPGLR